MRKSLVLMLALLGIPFVASAQVAVTGSISTAGADCSTATRCVSWSTVGLESFGVYINVATSGTFVYEVSQDATLVTNGTWVGINDSAGAASATADGAYYFANSGFLMFRVRASAISGTATVTQARGYGGSAGNSGSVSATITGEYNVTPPTLSDAGTDSLQLDVNGRLLTNIFPTTPAATTYVPIRITADGSTFASFGEDYLHDAALTPASTGGPMEMCRASTNAPATVAGDDAVLPWCLQTGARVIVGDRNEDEAEAAGMALLPIAAVVRTPGTGSTATSGDLGTINIDVNGYLITRNQDPCSALPKQYFPFDITASGTAEVTPSLSGSGNYWYICSINVITTAANNVNLVDDNTDGCGSVTASLISSGLAAGDGWGFGANGGIALGSGAAGVLKSVTSNSVLCFVSSASTELHGTIAAVPAP